MKKILFLLIIGALMMQHDASAWRGRHWGYGYRRGPGWGYGYRRGPGLLDLAVGDPIYHRGYYGYHRGYRGRYWGDEPDYVRDTTLETNRKLAKENAKLNDKNIEARKQLRKAAKVEE
jgi:hypothetical protein